MPDVMTEHAVQISQERDAIIARYGVWTEHNICLGGGVYTVGEHVGSEKLRRVVQLVSDLATKPIAELRILDLACLEGQYAIEFARQGAEVVAIEGREPNLEKARFAQRSLGLDNLRFELGDVRDLEGVRHGSFDVVLCLGILYHLDAPGVFAFVERIAEVCTHLAVFDTYISLTPRRGYRYKGAEYRGRTIPEHRPDQGAAERLGKLWSSLDNTSSVWLTRTSLLNLLIRCGFTSCLECRFPVEAGKPRDRVTLAAIKGRPMRILTNPIGSGDRTALLSEHDNAPPSHFQRPFADLSRQFVQLFPRALRRRTKALLRRLRVIRRPPARWETDARFRWGSDTE